MPLDRFANIKYREAVALLIVSRVDYTVGHALPLGPARLWIIVTINFPALSSNERDKVTRKGAPFPGPARQSV